MAKEKKNNDLKVVVVEFKVSMHCNACERTVAKTISKFKGVEKFTTEMKKHKVVVTGRIDPQKLLKKLKKKTKKKVEIIANKKEEEASKNTFSGRNLALEGCSQPVAWPSYFNCCLENEVLMTFSDENPNACSIM